MKVPNWFVAGCGLLVLNATLVLGGTMLRHASAETADERPVEGEALPAPDAAPDAAPADESPTPSVLDAPRLLAGENGGGAPLPQVPSLESSAGVPPANAPDVVHLDDFKPYLNALPSSSELLAPLDEMLKDSPGRASEQLSQSFFEALKLRLQTAEHLNQSALGLVEEAAILYQRGEVEKAQELLGIATQIREMTARLLVTSQ